MTEAELLELAEINNYEPTPELLSFARLAIMAARSDVLNGYGDNIRAAAYREREQCAQLCEAYVAPAIGKEMAEAIRSRGRP